MVEPVAAPRSPIVTCASWRGAVFRCFLLSGLALTCGRLEAADALAPPEFTTAERAAIGRAFAPILVFHPLEHYFPTSSMLPLGAGDGSGPARAGLEVWSLRVDSYRALSLAAKLQRAALGYRVFTRPDRDGPMQVVVEYWCYYVYNQFTVRGTWLPYRVRDNHPCRVSHSERGRQCARWKHSPEPV